MSWLSLNEYGCVFWKMIPTTKTQLEDIFDAFYNTKVPFSSSLIRVVLIIWDFIYLLGCSFLEGEGLLLSEAG